MLWCTELVTTLAGTGKPGFADGACDQAQFDHPCGVACAPDGKIYVADQYNRTVRCINRATKTVSTVAGDGTAGHKDGAGNQARLNYPYGLVFLNGKLYVTDESNHCVRCINIDRSKHE